MNDYTKGLIHAWIIAVLVMILMGISRCAIEQYGDHKQKRHQEQQYLEDAFLKVGTDIAELQEKVLGIRPLIDSPGKKPANVYWEIKEHRMEERR